MAFSTPNALLVVLFVTLALCGPASLAQASSPVAGKKFSFARTDLEGLSLNFANPNAVPTAVTVVPAPLGTSTVSIDVLAVFDSPPAADNAVVDVDARSGTVTISAYDSASAAIPANVEIELSLPGDFRFGATDFSGVALSCIETGFFHPICIDLKFQAIPAGDDFLEQVDPSVGYIVEDISQTSNTDKYGSLFYFSDGLYNTLFLVLDGEVWVVDAPEPAAGKLLDAIASVTAFPITKLIYSHEHSDHIASASLITDAFPDVEILASRLTADRLAEYADPRRPVPHRAIDGARDLKFRGRVVVELRHLFDTHAGGDLFLRYPAHNTIQTVDIVFPHWTQFRNLAETIDVDGTIRGHLVLLRLAEEGQWNTLVGGHFMRGTPQDVQDSVDLLQSIRTNSFAALGQFNNVFFEVFSTVGQNHRAWLTFRLVLEGLAKICAQNVQDEFGDSPNHLGLDVFVYSHCDTMIEKGLRIQDATFQIELPEDFDFDAGLRSRSSSSRSSSSDDDDDGRAQGSWRQGLWWAGAGAGFLLVGGVAVRRRNRAQQRRRSVTSDSTTSASHAEAAAAKSASTQQSAAEGGVAGVVVEP